MQEDPVLNQGWTEMEVGRNEGLVLGEQSAGVDELGVGELGVDEPGVNELAVDELEVGGK